MKLKTVLITLAVIFLIGIFYNLITTTATAAAGKLTLGEKLDALLLKQDAILTRLDKVYDELIKIKVRVSRNLK